LGGRWTSAADAHRRDAGARARARGLRPRSGCGTMDAATARVDEPVPPPDAGALLGGAAPGGAAGEPAATSGGDGGAVGGGASAAATPTLTVPAAVPAAAMPAAAVAPPPAAAGGVPAPAAAPAAAPADGAVPVAVAAVDDADGTAGAAVAEAAAPTAGEAGLCTLRFLLANSTEFRISTPPETTIRDIKTQIITQHPPRTCFFLLGSVDAGVCFVWGCRCGGLVVGACRTLPFAPDRCVVEGQGRVWRLVAARPVAMRRSGVQAVPLQSSLMRWGCGAAATWNGSAGARHASHFL